MSDPTQNRVGGTRGPDGRTLTDLYNQLVTMNAGLVAQAETLNAMNLRLQTIQAVSISFLEIVGGATAPIPGGFNSWKATADRLGSILGILEGEAAARSTARFAIGAIEATLGSLGEEPAGRTHKELLAEIAAEAKRQADCCEENGGNNGGGGFPDQTNPKPVDLCNDIATIPRVAGFQDGGTTTFLGGDVQVIIPRPTTIPDGSLEIVINQGSLNLAGYRHFGPGHDILLIEWDFTESTSIPVALTFASAFAGQGLFENNWYLGVDASAGDLTRGCFSVTLESCFLGAEEVEEYYFAFAFPEGTNATAITSNCWVSQQTIGCV